MSSDKIVKVLLFDKESNTVLVNNKFLETKIELSDYPVLLSPITDEKVKEELASKEAAKRTIKKLLDLKEIDEKRLSYQTLTEEEKLKYVNIVCYKLTDEEKIYIKNKSIPNMFINFYHINNLPTGLVGIDGGIAYFITRHFDIIKNAVYLSDPSIIYPSSIIVYRPMYSYPILVPRPVSYLAPLSYTSYSPTHSPTLISESRETVYTTETKKSSKSSRKSSSRSSRKSSSRSSRKATSSNSEKKKKRKKRNKEKYIKYKLKYLNLKKMLDSMSI